MGMHPWAPAEFVVVGARPKKAPHRDKRRPQIEEKMAKRSPHGEKVAERPRLLLPLLRAPMGVCDLYVNLSRKTLPPPPEKCQSL